MRIFVEQVVYLFLRHALPRVNNLKNKRYKDCSAAGYAFGRGRKLNGAFFGILKSVGKQIVQNLFNAKFVADKNGRRIFVYFDMKFDGHSLIANII